MQRALFVAFDTPPLEALRLCYYALLLLLDTFSRRHCCHAQREDMPPTSLRRYFSRAFRFDASAIVMLITLRRYNIC